jgi:ribosome-associated heat shock protein Hsp15
LERQRIDKWLWHARIVRTRSAAAALAASGHVRINGQRVNAPSRAVRPGDVVTVALDRAVQVLKVLDFSERRGSAEEARKLCEALGSAFHRTGSEFQPGGPRPTKRERRAFDRLGSTEDG